MRKPILSLLFPAALAVVPTAIAMGVMTLMSPAAQAADAERRAYDIAPGTLDEVLTSFARQAGVLLSFEPSLVAGKASAGLSGEHSPQSGFAALLTGHGIRYRFTAARSVLLEAGADDDALLLAPVRVETDLRRTDDATTERSGSYAARAARTSTRLPLSLRETPQSVSVVTRQMIDDRNFTTLGEAMEEVVGVTNYMAAQGATHYSSRGFVMAGNLIDGMPNAGGIDTGYDPNLAFFDRVEVLRGAAGLVYGAGNPGGVVNLVRKRPLAERAVSATFRLGSWEQEYVELDGSAPLNASGSVRGRAVVTYQDRENFIDAEYVRRPAYYGVVEADLGQRAVVHAGVSSERIDRNSALGLPRYADGGDLQLPRSSRGFAPDWNRVESVIDTVFAGVDVNLGERWDLKLAGTSQKRNLTQAIFTSSGAVNRDTLQGPAYSASWWGIAALPQKNQAIDLAITGRVDALGRTHELVFGGNWAENDWGYGRRVAYRMDAPVLTGTIFDFDPSSVPKPAEQERIDESSQLTTTQSVYAVAKLNLADALKLIAGGRLSSNETQSYMPTSRSAAVKESDVFTPYGGLIFDVSTHWSTYASYTDIFRVQNTLFTAAGERLDPVVGANYEAGVKGEFRDGRLNVALAVFRIDEENRSQPDPNNLAPCAGSPTNGDCYIAEGKVRGEGFETELSGEILPGWEAVAGYAYVKTEYLRDRTRTGEPSGNEGKPFRSTTPEHLFKLWTNYRLPAEWAAWSVGGGVSSQSDTYNESNGVRVAQGGYSIWNARIGYRLDEQWSLALNGNNLTDKTYYQRVGSVSGGNRYGEPRNWAVTLRGNF